MNVSQHKTKPSGIKGFQKEFYIFKEGSTDRRKAILSKNGEPFNKQRKIAFYKSMGFTVYDLDGATL